MLSSHEYLVYLDWESVLKRGRRHKIEKHLQESKLRGVLVQRLVWFKPLH